MHQSHADPFDAELGRTLRELRLARGLSQQQVSEQIGLSFQQLQKYERGTNRIAVARLFQLAKGLGYSPIDILKTHSALRGADNTTGAMPNLMPTSREQGQLLRYFQHIEQGRHRRLLIGLSRALARLDAEGG